MTPPQADRHEEPLEIVDEHGHVVGLAARHECHGNPLLRHRAVHVMVTDRRGRYFLQKRARTKRVQPGKWDTAVGGHLEPGESYEQGAVREMAEEIGLRDVPLEPLHEYVWATEIETEHVKTFRAVSEGPFRLQAHEIEDGRFWTEDEIRLAAGRGILSPSLEEELRRLNVLPDRPQKRSPLR